MDLISLILFKSGVFVTTLTVVGLFSQPVLALTTCQVENYAGKNGAASAYGGDGGDATSANLGLSFGGGLFMDSTKELFIADYANNRVRQVTPNPKVMTTFAGEILFCFLNLDWL